MYLRSMGEKHSVAAMTSCQHYEENVSFFLSYSNNFFIEKERKKNNWTTERFPLLSQTENLLFLFSGQCTLKKK